ncbi:hypothetical protein AVEN_189885-1 [Araneus ventricosus]|uniref:Uncharacterized protein n=1 Tax=Araneus ventricosus TaxID=182803 RepID=A0A4Y2EGA5_ARAVE|nr:hypothetical protein AVEN_189885-1 [Araneus ventricosus]
MLSLPPENIRTSLLLFTRRNRYNPVVFPPDKPELLLRSEFNSTAWTRILIHGYQDGSYSTDWLFTDSEICLHWIKSSATEWKQFVSNRVVEIQDCVVPDRWFHCPGLENPADRLTRGVSAVSLKSDDLWWSGPRWLKSPRYDWPQQRLGEKWRRAGGCVLFELSWRILDLAISPEVDPFLWGEVTSPPTLI